ncbi:helix-turn-helix domain-containing protein [Flavobacterium sp. F-65]|uniref:Helix-turn-helix domain-containing protein n=1 Tax=Flavobacterium pisciphilum TaxID=2893755 RepID=A0ABS8MNH5_9FLAO|nr:helix-turn-helix domain-containing protein [Flavobacterium sp. F-65]MCC9070317.1 helix-turn-helix domain-containing protein [Flavobacterium sp. F-65]
MDNHIVSQASDFNTNDLKLKGFKVYEVNSGVNAVPTYNRRDFYKICINTSKSLIHYADRGIETDGTILFFGNPHIPYSWEIISPIYSGYACVFTEDFLKVNYRSDSLHESPLFKIGGTPIFSLTPVQEEFITSMFIKMISEQDTDYIFKDDLIRNYINLIIHESLKMQPSENFFKHKNASSRITTLFLELLERQFPIETKDQPLKLKTPQDYAQNLAVHVNHLNRSVKEITGKSTTTHISERIISEAKALLQHTDWSIADIGFSLGFEYPSYFNNYFKRLTGTVPKTLRM